MNLEKDRLLTVRQVAEILQSSETHVYRKISKKCENPIPHIKFEKSVRIRESDLQKWIEEYKKGCTK